MGKLTFLRLVVISLVVGPAIVMLQVGGGSQHNEAVLYGLLGVLLLTTASIYGAFRAGVPLPSIIWGGIVTDGAALSMMSYYSGGALLYVAPLCLLPIVMSGYLSKLARIRKMELAEKERELLRMQHHTDSILMNVSSGLIVMNLSGEIVTCNPAAAAILGLGEVEDIKGRLIQDVMPHMPTLVQELAGALATGVPRHRHEVEIRRCDGVLLPLGMSISLLKAECGEKRGAVAIFQDLTEVHEMQDKVRRADKMAAVGELSTAIAHEIRAPLASICGSIEMLAGELSLSGDNEKLMELVLKESDRLDRIITDFLEFARLRSPAFEPVDVEQCLNEVLMLVRHSTDLDPDLSIEIYSDAPGARIYADDEQIRQVFLNLIINACEAIAGGGRLRVRIEGAPRTLLQGSRAEKFIAICFENSGPAIPEDVLPHIFEPFYTTKDGGTGLGLAIVARIVESHHGHVRVTSAEGHGAVFTVVLPVCGAQESRPVKVLQEEFISF